MQLTRNFSLIELTRSEMAARRGWSNVPDSVALAHLTMLAWYVLEPLREKLGRPILINSGYRNKQVNTVVGGADNSLHMLGRAADIVVPGVSPFDVARAALSLGLPTTEVILEFGEWVHVAVAEPGKAPERRLFTAVRDADGTVTYKRGLLT